MLVVELLNGGFVSGVGIGERLRVSRGDRCFFIGVLTVQSRYLICASLLLVRKVGFKRRDVRVKSVDLRRLVGDRLIALVQSRVKE